MNTSLDMTCHRKPAKQDGQLHLGPFVVLGNSCRSTHEYKFLCSEAMPKVDWSIAGLGPVKELLEQQLAEGKFRPKFRCGL